MVRKHILLLKQPFGNATACHVDIPYWLFDSPREISAWIVLDDSTKRKLDVYISCRVVTKLHLINVKQVLPIRIVF
jgi:hypothetical protein